MNVRSLWNLRTLLALFASASMVSALVAQTVAANDDGKKDEPIKLEKFIVTGSLIPIAANTPAIQIGRAHV